MFALSPVLRSLPVAGMLFVTAPLFAQFYEAEQEVYEAPNEGQKRSVQTLEDRIRELSRSITGYHGLLKASNLIDKNGTSRIPLRAEQQNFYGQYDKRYVYNEVAVIHWQDETVRYFFFEQRQSHRERVQVLLKRWYGRNVGGGPNGPENPGGFQGVALDVVVRRIDTYEGSGYLNQRLFTGRDLRDLDPGTPLPAGSGEQVDKLPRVYVNEVSRRLKFLRDYRMLLELLERRIDRAVRDAKKRNETRFELLDRALR